MATIMHAEPHDQRQHDEEKPDPFARSATDHPAISQSVGVSPDIYRHLFDVFFESEIFQRWLHRQNTWQLHCIGGPGCGKSTFAALALERIREHYHDSIHNTIQVASLFVADIALENELIFVEDCLRHVYYQLSPIGKVAKLVSTKCYDRYATARDKGRRIAVRIECIAHALRQRLLEIGEKGVAFLVVDNLDRCSPTLIEILERELSTLQKLGLGIMTTSRLPKHDKLEDVWCDYHERGPHDPALHFYWRCSCCERRYMCERETCYRVDRVCDECAEDTSWAQPEHMNIFLEGMWEGYLRDFMAWDMEREHGDLGLGSSADKPPLSAFGYAFRRAGLGYDWIAQNLWYVNNSVVQTKLALDRIHAASSPEEVEPLPNRMPANMQALYTNALKAIESQPAGQRELAMRSIAAVGKRAKTDAGLPVTILADLVRGRPSTVDVSRVPPRSVEDILTSTKGYLRLQAPTAEQSHYNVAAFDRLFFDFLNQDYSDIVVMANALLRTSNIPRSLTRGHFEPSKSHFEVPQLSRQDMFKELREFRSPKLVSSPGESPGPLRRTSSGVKRSQTLISFEMPQESPPVLGLGLDPASFGSQL